MSVRTRRRPARAARKGAQRPEPIRVELTHEQHEALTEALVGKVGIVVGVVQGNRWPDIDRASLAVFPLETASDAERALVSAGIMSSSATSSRPLIEGSCHLCGRSPRKRITKQNQRKQEQQP